jgi:hypothetical protein
LTTKSGLRRQLLLAQTARRIQAQAEQESQRN